jgi:hypothetical protein
MRVSVDLPDRTVKQLLEEYDDVEEGIREAVVGYHEIIDVGEDSRRAVLSELPDR